MWQVYILKCNDGTYYAGCTSDLPGRLIRRNKGQVKYTSTRLPIEVVVIFSNEGSYLQLNTQAIQNLASLHSRADKLSVASGLHY
jgi:predicted GIY-YIG superfamily endonuclease